MAGPIFSRSERTQQHAFLASCWGFSYQGDGETRPNTSIRPFFLSSTLKPMSVSDVQLERSFNVRRLSELVSMLHPIAGGALHKNRGDRRNSASNGNLPKFMVGNFVSVAREHFHANEKLCLRWGGSRGVINATSDYVYEVEDLCNGITDKFHVSRFNFYSDYSLDKEAIISHALILETGMVVHCLLRLEEIYDGLCAVVSSKGLPT